MPPALPWKSFASPETAIRSTPRRRWGKPSSSGGRRRDRPSHRIGVRPRSASESGRHAALQWDLFLDRSIYLLIFLDPDPTGGFTVWPMRR